MILIPEIPYDLDKVAEKIAERERKGRNFSIVVVAEGATGRRRAQPVAGRRRRAAERLGGVGEKVARRSKP